ncbi:MAG TPA: DUF2442 domain-containing protein [Candidatus Kapabacteria bacterium]|nr:DUF2442 domain-containing protein [Candidatus Kapabacteria bacterium]
MLTITSVIPLEGYRLKLRFSDGTEGIADLSDIRRNGVFQAWNDPDFFRSVSIDPESQTVTWPTGIDLDPYVLYSRATGRAIDQVLELV